MTRAVEKSSGRRRGPSKGDLKEAAILDVAWRLLTEKSLAEITVNDLTRGAGISRSSFYFYFDSKEAVLRALAQRAAAEIRSSIGGFETDAEGRVGDLRAVITGYLRRWQESGPVLRAIRLQVESDPDLREFWAQIRHELVDDVARSIDRAQRAGIAAAAPPAARDLAEAMIAMMLQSAYQHSLEPADEAAEQRLVDTLTVVSQRMLGLTGQ
ncbi:TetR/AcrR family transcriptional regulator [Nocardia sp. NPDC005366]|uniref:TetR/AcrR family transcriptional regulator n=1 Tax=Nocardia sp. NPDC005366 TaxID=3156878 RepID=UPI0033A4DBF9